MDKAFKIQRVWRELVFSNNWDISDKSAVITWNPSKAHTGIQGLATLTYVRGAECHQWNSSQKTNPTNKKPTSFSLKHDLFISRNVSQLKSRQPDPNLSYSPNLWSSLQKPFQPQAMISSDLISEMGPGLTRTVEDTSEGTPDASGSSWGWFSEVTLLEVTPNPHPMGQSGYEDPKSFVFLNRKD